MKTKHFLYSMALIAALGACSSENLEVTDTDVQDLSVRPLIGDVELTIGDAQTRFATGTGAQPVFADGDKLGACIIDVPNYANGNYDPNTTAVSKYQIVEYYSSNNAFTNNNGIWKVDQPMVEGNYLFYAPYNQKMQARTPLSIKVPVKQTATSEKAALDEFYKSGAVVRVGYQFLAANNGVAQKPNVTMNDVFAYPLFTIKNNFKGLLVGTDGKNTVYNGGAITLDSIQIQQVNSGNNANEVVCGGVLKHAGDEETGEDATEGVVGMMRPEGTWDISPMGNYTEDLLDGEKTVNNGDDETKRDRTKGVITTLVCDKEIVAGGEYKVHGVLPAMRYTDTNNSMRVVLFITVGEKHYMVEDAKVTAIVNNGAATYTVDERKGGSLLTSAAGTISLIKGQKYPQEELNFENNRLTAKQSAGQILTIDLKGGLKSTDYATAQVATELDASAAAPVTEIKTNAEFKAFFKEQLNGVALTEGEKTEGATFKVAENNTLVINSEMIDALFTYNNKGTLTLKTALPIAKDVTIIENGIEGRNVTFESATGNTYKITLEEQNYVIDETGTVEVNTGDIKTVIVNSVCTAFTNTGGTIKTLYVVRNKSLTTSRAVTIQGNVINDGTITVAVGNDLTPTSLINNGVLGVSGQIGNLVENNGEININATTANVVVSAGNGKITMAEANKAARVTVNGGNQEGVYVLDAFDKDGVKEGDAVDWINAVKVDETAAFTTDVVTEMKDIKKVYATSATFGAATFDMKDKTLVLSGSAKTIVGNGISTSIVKNITILNTGDGNVNLTNIAMSGVFSNDAGVESAKITANGTDATWNGAKAE